MKKEEFTKREIEILQMISQGYVNRVIAEKLKISNRTVQNHETHMYRKSGVHSMVELIVYGLQKGYVKIQKNK